HRRMGNGEKRMIISTSGLLHVIVDYFFHFLQFFLVVRVLLSWIPIIPQGHPIVRFFVNVTDPVLTPIAKRVPPLSAGALNTSITVAFIFMVSPITMLDATILYALPADW